MPGKIKYVYPLLSKLDIGIVRFGGPGMGNLLFPVARALIFAHKTGAVFVPPTWAQIKLGPTLRREADKRIYWGVFKRRGRDEWLLWLTVIYFHLIRYLGGNNNIQFESGLARYFKDLEGGRDLLRHWLIENSLNKPSHQKTDIGIHFRQGDFVGKDPSAHNSRVSLSWLQNALDHAVKLYGDGTPAITIFSDGDTRSLQRMAAQYGRVRIDDSENAIQALLNLSKSTIIVASRSTFSGWGSYLGDAITIWPYGFELEQYNYIRPGKDIFVR